MPDTKTHTIVTGEGPPVVLVHGVGLDHAMWDLVAAGLSPYHRVVRYDVLGHGRTPAKNGSLGFDDLVGQLHDVLETQRIGATALVGFSLGALIAQAFTLAWSSKVSKLVLLNSAYVRTPEQQAGIRSRLKQVEQDDVAANIDASIKRWFTGKYRTEHPDQIKLVEDRIRNNDKNGFLAAYRLFVNSDDAFQGKLPGIGVPTLVITGRDDVGSTPQMSRAIARQIPDSRLEIFEDVKHMLPVENADKLSKKLLQFLGEDR